MTVARSRLARWLVPFAVVALVLGVAGLRATLANAAPSLPKLTAAQLLAKVAQADVKSLSGTVRTSADLGLPPLPSTEGELGPQALLSGEHTLRVFFDGPQRQRVDLLGRLAETKLVHNDRDLWYWSSSANKATHTRLPALPADLPGTKMDPRKMPAGTPQAFAQMLIDAITPTTQVSVGTAATVAGRPAYDLRLTPKTADSLIKHADLYVDSATGLPLRATVLARGASKPAIDVGYTKITFSAPAASVFKFSAPAGAKVTEKTFPGLGCLRGLPHPDKAWPRDAVPGPNRSGKARPDKARPPGAGDGPRVHGSGWATAVEIRGLPAGSTSDPRFALLLKGARTETGRFGSGKVLTTRLLTVLITDDGRIFAGAVTVPALLRIANAAGPR